MRPALPDVLCERPRVLFVGINPSLRSGEVGHHFASPGNPFWRLLHASGLVPALLRAEEDRRLADLGFALTNVCPRPTRAASELTSAEYRRGVRALRAKIRRLRPAVVAFVGLSVYQRFFGHPKSGGPGAKPEVVGEARVFVLPNPSGLNARFPGFQSKLVWFAALKEILEERRPRPEPAK